jgi:predicted ATPase
MIPVLFYLWMHHTARLELQEGLKIVAQLDELARLTGDSYAFIVARNVENMNYGWMGNFARAGDAARRGVAAYEPERHAPLVQIYNHDQKCGILSWAVHFLWIQGYPDQAQAAAQEQVDLARQLGHPFNLAFSLTTGCAALVQRGEGALARRWIVEADAIGKENAISYMTHFFVPFWTGLLEVSEFDYERGYADITTAWQYFANAGGTLLEPFANTMRATALMKLGRTSEARALLDHALLVIRGTGHRMHEAEVYRVLGELHLEPSAVDRAAAEGLLLRALEVAEAQAAKGWGLRAALSLARL